MPVRAGRPSHERQANPVSDFEEPEEKEPKIRVLLCTCPSADAEGLATFLVETRLVACVNIIPQVMSLYRWEGKLHRDAESLLVIKCAKKGHKKVIEAIVQKHPYDVPEVIALNVKGGNADYLEWVERTGIR